jgi:GT2 family glycosyltransferase
MRPQGPVSVGREEAVRSVRVQLDESQSEQMWRVVVVIVTWNSSNHINQCLESLRGSTIPVAVVVVDNGSCDGTVDLVRTYRGRPVTTVETGANLGYAGGNNVGLEVARAAGADVVFLINPDATVDPGCLEALVPLLIAGDAVGMVSPAICYSGSDRIWYGGADFDPVRCTTYHLNEGRACTSIGKAPFETVRASGCVLGVRSDVVEQIGYLDERYFLYYEETEWSLRMRRAGLRIVVVPLARAWHDTGHGRGSATATYQYYMTRNRLLIAKEYGKRGLRGVLSASVRDSAITLLATARKARSSFWPCVSAVAHGYVDGLRGKVGARAQ